MKYVGLDLHAKQSTVAILDDEERTKEPRTRTIHGSLKTVLEEVSKIKGPYEVVYEASNGYGVVYDELAKTASRVVVAHPGQLRLIFRSKDKNNRADAKRLVRLLRAGFVPQVHVPKRDVRRWRRLIVHRSKLVGGTCAGEERDSCVAARAWDRGSEGSVVEAWAGVAARGGVRGSV